MYKNHDKPIQESLKIWIKGSSDELMTENVYNVWVVICKWIKGSTPPPPKKNILLSFIHLISLLPLGFFLFLKLWML